MISRMTFFFKISLLSVLLLPTMVSAENIIEDEKKEICSCWQAIFEREYRALLHQFETTAQLKHDRDVIAEKMEECEYFIDCMIPFQDEDFEQALFLVVSVCSHPLWEAYAEQPDAETADPFVRYMIRELNHTIHPDCNVKFPPLLHELAETVDKTGLDDDEFCIRLRRACIACTIITTRMAYLAQE